MKTFWKVLTFTIILSLMAFGLIACGSKDSGDKNSGSSEKKVVLDNYVIEEVTEEMEKLGVPVESDKDEAKFTATVSSETATFSFASLIGEKANVLYTVYADEACTEEITNADLSVGDNTFYIVAQKGNKTKTYSFVVTRSEAPEPTHKHSYGEWKTVTPATCIAAGLKKRVCECGEEETETIDTTNHTVVIDQIVTPTCTETGLTEGEHCSVCGKILLAQQIIEALGYEHVEVIDQAVTPTCTKTGLTEGKHCSVCGKILLVQQTIEAMGHVRNVDQAVAPTCTETGLTEGEHCSICGEILVMQQILKAMGHDKIIDQAVAPTCTETGLTEGRHCSSCKEIFVKQEVIPVLGHSFGEWNIITVATCTEAGEKQHICVTCNMVQDENIPAVGHTFGLWLVEKEASCTESGMRNHVCNICDWIESEVIPEKGHHYKKSVCVDCKECLWENKDWGVLNKYNGHYGYDFLGTTSNGTAKQQLYQQLDEKVKMFHVDPSLDANEGTALSINLSEYSLTTNEVINVWKTFKDDNPLYYWMSNTVSLTEEELLIIISSNDYAVGETRIAFNDFLYEKIDAFVSIMRVKKSNYKKALCAHDLIIDEIDYSRDDQGQPEPADWAHSIVGVFDKRGAVCEGYARSFQLLLNYFSIENVFVSGQAGEESHAWNLAKMDNGEWYWYDVTWDDIGLSYKLGVVYDYCCVNDDEMIIGTNSFGWDGVETNFIQTHTFDTSSGQEVSFLYDLPKRADTSYSIGTEDFIIDECRYKIIGADKVALCTINGNGDVTIPETVVHDDEEYSVVYIASDFIFASNISSVFIPKTISFIEDFAFDGNIENIYVDEDNPYFTSVDGVLFTKSLYTLIAYPNCNSRVEYIIPDETRIIASRSFQSNKYLEKLTIGKNVEGIGMLSGGMRYLDSKSTGWFGGNYLSGEISRIYGCLTGEKKIEIHSDNKNYIIEDGVVYSYDKRTLYCVIDDTITSIYIPQETEYFDTEWISLFPYEINVDPGNKHLLLFDGILYRFEGDRCSQLYERRGDTYTIYDDCNPFGMISKDFGDITNLSKHTTKSAPESTIDSFNSLSELFATFMGNFEISTAGPGSVLSIEENASENYGAFYDKAVELYKENSLIPLIKNINRDPAGSAVIGANYPYVLKGSDVPSDIDYQRLIANLFGFSDKDEFRGYAQDLADMYATYRTKRENSEPANEALGNGCFFTVDGSFVFPVAVVNNIPYDDSSVVVVHMYIIIDSNGFVSIWVNDFASVLWAINFNNIYHTNETSCNAFYCKNCLFVPEPNSDKKPNNIIWVDPLIEEVTIMDGLSSIDKGVFQWHTELTRITIPDSVTSIGNNAFSGCSGLTSITIPDSVTSIGNSAFSDCSGLTSITIPDSVTSIGNSTFFGCSSLTSVAIPNSVKSIEGSAFSHSSSLTSVTIGSGVTSIGDWAFDYCSSLTNIIFAGTMAQWNAIRKGSDWDGGTGSYTVHCTDGDIAK